MKNSSVCVDANLIIWSLAPFPLSAPAKALLRTLQQTQTTLIAPARLAFEVTASLRRLVYLKQIAPEEGEEAFQRFLRMPVRLSHRKPLFPLAWELAKRFNRSCAYDTVYLALAQLDRCDFWTADEKLYHAVKDHLPWVHWIGHAGLPKIGGSAT